MVQDIIIILGTMAFIIITIILMGLTFDMIIGMVGVLDFLMVHLILGGVIITGDQVGRIGDLIITDLHIITGIIITIHIDLHIIEEMVFIGMKDQLRIDQIDVLI
jgi:hypothetical protein